MLAGHFQNMFYDLGEKFGLKFVRAQCDKVVSSHPGAAPGPRPLPPHTLALPCRRAPQVTPLKQYKDTAEPVFLFYLDGDQLNEIRGPNIPSILEFVKSKAPAVDA